MCNPNSTISAYRRRLRAQQLRELQASGSETARRLLAHDFSEQMPTNPTRDTVPTNEILRSKYTPSSPTKIEFSVMGIPATLPSFPDFQTAMKPSAPKPKRRRKPQKPGKTAKQNDRHFVIHNYHDHANENKDEEDSQDSSDRKGGVSVSFPIKLHRILDQVAAEGLSHIISWQPHGRCFVIRKPKEFADHVMPGYFRQTKLTSFQRQLNLYGFNRVTRGHDSGGYYHELFLRGKPFLCKHMVRTKVKGTKFKAASSPNQEPNFYLMVSIPGGIPVHSQYHLLTPGSLLRQPPVQSTHRVTPHHSDCDTSDDGRSYAVYHEVPAISTSQQDAWRQRNQEPASPQSVLNQDLAFVFSHVTPVSTATTQPYAPSGMTTSSNPINYPILPHQNSLDDADLNELFHDQLPQDTVHQDSTAAVEDMDLANIWDPISYGREDTTGLANDAQLSNLLGRLLE
jgi:hypothetical protein